MVVIVDKISDVIKSQRDVAMISEMIHSASLIHDDVIDQSDYRRGKSSANVLWNNKKVSKFNLTQCYFRANVAIFQKHLGYNGR